MFMDAGTIRGLLEADHRRLEGFLAEAFRGDPGAYASFRLGLLRHIAMEEKILAPAAREALGKPHPVVERLRTDHSLLATLLIPSPTPSILTEMKEILEAHDLLEEGEGGFYHDVETLVPDSVGHICQQLREFPDPKPARHVDNEAVRCHLEDLRDRRRRLIDGGS